MCAFKCLLKSPAWIHIGCIWFFSIIMCFQICPHCENILTPKDRGGRSWLTLKSHFTLYKQIPKNPGISFSKIPGFWSTENPGIPLGPADDCAGRGCWGSDIRALRGFFYFLLESVPSLHDTWILSWFQWIKWISSHGHLDFLNWSPVAAVDVLRVELKSRGENGKGMKLETRLLQGKGEKEAFDDGIKFWFFLYW